MENYMRALTQLDAKYNPSTLDDASEDAREGNFEVSIMECVP